MHERAAAEGWKYREETGKGGTRRVFWFLGLPGALQNAILNACDEKEGTDPALLPPWVALAAPKAPAALPAPKDDASLPALPAHCAPVPSGVYLEHLLKPGFPATQEEKQGFSSQQIIVANARLSMLRWLARRAAERDISLWSALGECAEALPDSLWLLAAIANDRNTFEWKIELSDSGDLLAVATDARLLARFGKLPSWETMQRWAAGFCARGWAALAPAYKKRDMRAPVWMGEFLKEMQRPQKPSVAAALRQAVPALQEKGIKVPPQRTVHRWYATKYSNLDKHRGRNTGSAMNPHKFSHRMSDEGMYPLDEVHSDGWSTHFLAPHPVSGKFVKLEVWHSHDLATRYNYPPSVGLSESTQVILASIAAVIAVDGVPAVWQTDSTGSVKNDRVEYDPVASIAARAGMTIAHTRPGNAQANGIPENFNKYLDSRSKELATYQGRDMDPLTGKRVLKITQKMVAAATHEEALALRAEAERMGKGLVFESFAQAKDWLTRVFEEFNDRPHSTLPKIDAAEGRRHMTPREMKARFVEHKLWTPCPLSIEPLADLLRVHEKKKVIRGCVSIMSQRYHHRDLDHLNGELVLVAFDIHDGTRVWVKDLEGNLLCVADLYEARGRRAMSFMEMALEKRADGQQRRLQRKFDDIEAQRPGRIIEQRGRAALSVVEQPAIEAAPESAPLPVVTGDASPAVTADAEASSDKRPNFQSDLEMLYWLHEHREQMDDDDWTYLTKDASARSDTVDRELRRLFGQKDTPAEGAGEAAV